MRGHIAESGEHYTRCIEAIQQKTMRADEQLNTELLLAYSNRAQVRLKLGQYREALADAESALKLDPLHKKTIFRKTTALYKLGRPVEATEAVRAAIGPDDEDLQREAEALFFEHVDKKSVELMLRTMHAHLQRLHRGEGSTKTTVNPKQLGSGIRGSPLTVPLCSNPSCTVQLLKNDDVKVLNCKCGLVSYCSSRCNKQCSKVHRDVCGVTPNSWKTTSGGRIDEPLVTSHLWGNVPATSLLNPKLPVPDNVKLCFAASGDLRDMFTTLYHLPPGYTGKVTIVVNDHQSHVMVRNFLILEMLRLHGKDAIDAAIALWYSYTMTKEQIEALDSAAWDAIQRCGYLQRTTVTTVTSRTTSLGRGQAPLVAAFQGGSSTLSASFGDEYWAFLYEIGKEFKEAAPSAVRTARNLKNQPASIIQRGEPRFVVPWLQFMTRTGLMLPFSRTNSQHSQEAANKYLLDPTRGWTMSFMSDPRIGWKIEDLEAGIRESGLPWNDLYGGLFFHLRKLMSNFVDVVESTEVELKLFGRDASLLAAHDLKSEKFHAVSTSNIADADYLGLERVLADWGPRLATGGTLITMQMQWHLPWNLRSLTVDQAQQLQESINLRKLLGVPQSADPPRGRLGKSDFHVGWWWRTDIAYEEYLRKNNVGQVAAKAGLKMRAFHQLVPPRIGVPLEAAPSTTPIEYPSSLNTADAFYYRSCMERYAEWTTV